MAEADSFCGHCGEKATSHCKGCMNMTYCSVECQQADWQYHKLLCKEWKAFAEKPGPDVRRAILLPEHGTKPSFIWLRVPEGSDDYAAKELGKKKGKKDLYMDFADDLGVPCGDRVEGMVFPEVDDALWGADPPRNWIDVVCGKMGSGELLDHSIHLWMADFSGTTYPNKCLTKLAGGDVASRYRGNLVFTAMTKVESPSWTLDVDTRDLTLALDGLKEYNKKVILQHLSFELPKEPKKVPGLKFDFGRPYVETIKVPVQHPVYGAKFDRLPIVAKLDLPFRVYECPSKASIPAPAPSVDASYLSINIDANSEDFSKVPPTSEGNSPSFIIVDTDDKHTDSAALTPLCDTVTSLCDFIKDTAQPMLAKATTGSGKEREAAVEALKSMWEQHRLLIPKKDDADVASHADDASTDSYSSNPDDDESDGDDGEDDDYNDLADMRAKFGSFAVD